MASERRSPAPSAYIFPARVMGNLACAAVGRLEPYLLRPEYSRADLAGRFAGLLPTSGRSPGSVAAFFPAWKKRAGPIDPEAGRAGNAFSRYFAADIPWRNGRTRAP